MTIAIEQIPGDEAASNVRISSSDSPMNSGVLIFPSTTHAVRAADDEVNRFLLCVLVSKSAKQIKDRAWTVGESVPLTTIVRNVLRSYRAAAKESPGLLSGHNLGQVNFGRLNGDVFDEQMRICALERVKYSQSHVDRASQTGDETRIRPEREAHARDIAERDSFANRYAYLREGIGFGPDRTVR